MFREILTAKLSGVAALDAGQLEELERHYRLLVRWNRSLNLTTVVGEEEAVERHYCEGVFLAARLAAGSQRVADIGSGAGFPGFVVGVCRPDCEITLVESHQRKAVFLREACRGLPNVRVFAGRAEELCDGFDVAVSRAVSYKDLGRVLKNIAPHADLLTGNEEPPAGMGFEWSAPVPLPWARARFLRSGERMTGK